MKYGNQVISSIRLGSQAIITKIAKGLVVVYEAWKTLIKRGKTPLTITNCQPDTTAIDYTIYGGNDFKLILPDEYQQVEYIQTTGTQYIDSKIPLKCGLKTIVEWTYADADSGNNYTGGHIGSPGNRWLIGSQRQKAYYFGIGSSNTSTGVKFGDRDVIEAYWQNTGSYIKINGADPWNITQIATTPLLEEPDYTFYMGATNRDGKGILNPKLTIYNWKFYQDDVLLRDFIPCYRKSDKVAGLYDVVTNEFYINNGTGEFVVGGPILLNPTPDSPVEMKGVGTLQDSGEYIIPISITNNLFNNLTLEQGSIIDATGILVDSDSRVRTNLFELEAGQYTIKMNWSLQKCMVKGIHLYNSTDDAWIKYLSISTSTADFTLLEKTKVRIVFNKSTSAGTTITPEEVWNSDVGLYASGVSETVRTSANLTVAEPLRKLGMYMDYLHFGSQKIYRPIYKRVLDGSENWEEHTTAQGCKVYRLDGVLTPKVGAFMSDTYMTHFSLTYTYSTSDFIPGVYRFASSNPVDVISTNGRLYVSSTCETVEEFKEWLSVNKPSIYYPLAETEIIDIELPGLYLTNKINIITVDTEVSPDAIEITYKGRE